MSAALRSAGRSLRVSSNFNLSARLLPTASALNAAILGNTSAAAAAAAAVRGYKSPARDAMTGEIIQLPDIDVSLSLCCTRSVCLEWM